MTATRKMQMRNLEGGRETTVDRDRDKDSDDSETANSDVDDQKSSVGIAGGNRHHVSPEYHRETGSALVIQYGCSHSD